MGKSLVLKPNYYGTLAGISILYGQLTLAMHTFSGVSDIMVTSQYVLMIRPHDVAVTS